MTCWFVTTLRNDLKESNISLSKNSALTQHGTILREASAEIAHVLTRLTDLWAVYCLLPSAWAEACNSWHISFSLVLVYCSSQLLGPWNRSQRVDCSRITSANLLAIITSKLVKCQEDVWTTFDIVEGQTPTHIRTSIGWVSSPVPPSTKHLWGPTSQKSTTYPHAADDRTKS